MILKNTNNKCHVTWAGEVWNMVELYLNQPKVVTYNLNGP